MLGHLLNSFSDELIKLADEVKKKIEYQGIELHLDRPKGFLRKGAPDPQTGKSKSFKYKQDYGFVPGVNDFDGEELDVFVGPHKEAPHVYIAEKYMRGPNGQKTTFDEHKCFLGFKDEKDVVKSFGYHIHPGCLGDIHKVSVNEFKKMIAVGGVNMSPLPIRFPESELESLRARIKAGKQIVTTRVADEQGMLEKGFRHNTPLGPLWVNSVQTLTDVDKHPFVNELTPEQKKLLAQHGKYDVVTLEKVAAHAADRMKERTKLKPEMAQHFHSVANKLTQEGKFGTHYLPVPGHGIAAFSTVGDAKNRRVVWTTMLKSDMNPRGMPLSPKYLTKNPTSAELKVEAHHGSPSKDWKTFEKNLKKVPFQKAVVKHPDSDSKLKRYAKNYGGHLVSKEVVKEVPSRTTTKKHAIKKLPSGRLSCSCKDWQYVHSHKGTDCDHIKMLDKSKLKAASILPRFRMPFLPVYP